MKRLLLLALCMALPLGPGLSGAEPALSQDALLRAALRDNPSLQAARARWEMMKQRVPQARAWDDPMAGIKLERMGTLRPDRVSDVEWMVSQSLPISGKNLSRARASEAEALAAFEEFRRARFDVVLRVRAAYARLAGAQGQLGINRRNDELLGQFADLSRKKYEVGTATQSDVLLAETEKARLAETRAMIERDVSDQQTQLNVVANRPPASPLGSPTPPRLLPAPLSPAQAETLAARSRPEILLAWRKIEAEHARLQLAHRQWIPDPQVVVAARQYSAAQGVREYDTGIVFSIPWVNGKKYSAGVAEARESLAGARHDYDAARVEAAGLVRDQLKKIETAAANYRLYHEKIAPMAQAAVDAARSGYETDKNGFLDLITAQRTLQDV
ncbi:MAG: TolC family protein, partial [Chthoniobacteraceae bacterium]|nr:TolC family protein [Chthoniobacteraceae bacterium]